MQVCLPYCRKYEYSNGQYADYKLTQFVCINIMLALIVLLQKEEDGPFLFPCVQVCHGLYLDYPLYACDKLMK